MNKLIGLALIVVGAVLLYFGYQSSQGLDDQLSQTLTGNFTDETVFYYVGGAVAVIAGLFFVRRR